MKDLAPLESPNKAAERRWTVRPGMRSTEAPAAWRLVGPDPSSWLRELLTWPAALVDVQLLPLPSAENPQAIGGVLAIPPLGQGPRAESPAAHPYVRRGGRMYLPADAELSPPSTDAEIAASAVDDLLVFAPHAGWIGADAAELRSAAQLVAAPPSAAAVWDRAAPGWPAPRPLRAVRLVGADDPLLEPPASTTPSDAEAPSIEAPSIEAADVDALLFEPPPPPPAFAPVAETTPPPRKGDGLRRFLAGAQRAWSVVHGWVMRRLYAFVLWVAGDRDAAPATDAPPPPPSRAAVVAAEVATWVVILCLGAAYVWFALWIWSGAAARTLPWGLAYLASLLLFVIAPAFLLLAALAFLFRRNLAPRPPGFPLPPPPPQRMAARVSAFTESAASVMVTPLVLAASAVAAVIGGGIFLWAMGLRRLGVSLAGFGRRNGLAPVGSGLAAGSATGGTAPVRSNAMMAAAARWSQEALAAAFVKWMELFQRDPERALPYAIPIGGEPGAPPAPSTQFFSWMPRDAAFRLDSFFSPPGAGGGSIELPPWLVSALGDRYRAEAERLVRLKEYRKAAYIYGTLLRDYRMAADCLEREGSWREAAEIHLRRLQDPAAAARCLEEAGFFREAAELRETLAQWLLAAKLYARIDDAPRAERCFRLAVRDFLRQGDHQAAGDVLRDHLRDPSAARAEYYKGWAEAERTACLAPWLALSAPPHLAEPDLAPLERKLTELQTSPPLLALLQAVRNAKPAGIPDLADRLLPTVQRVVGRWLPKTTNRVEAAELIENLAWCNHDDPRVGRDGRRFLDALAPAVSTGTWLRRP